MHPQNLIENPFIPYSFNGIEKDNEVKGEGNSYDFGARMLDPRIGRFLSLDALADEYPTMSPYSYVANSVLMFIDPDGNKIIVPELLRTPAKTMLQNRINNHTKGTLILFRPKLSVARDGEIEFKSDKEKQRADRFIKRNYNSKNDNKRQLATLYNFIVSEDKVELTYDDKWEDEYNDLDIYGKKAMRDDLLKDWQEELDEKIEKINPSKAPMSTSTTGGSDKSKTGPSVGNQIKNFSKKVINNIKDKFERTPKYGPKKSEATGIDLDENARPRKRPR